MRHDGQKRTLNFVAVVGALAACAFAFVGVVGVTSMFWFDLLYPSPPMGDPAWREFSHWQFAWHGLLTFGGMFALFVGGVCAMIALKIGLFANVGSMLRYGKDEMLPVAAEAARELVPVENDVIRGVAPAIGDVAREVARGIREGSRA